MVEVAAEVQRAEFDDSFGHGRSPAHAGALHAVPDEILASPSTGPLAMGYPAARYS